MIDEKQLILHLNDWLLQESILRQMKNPADVISDCIKAVEEQPKIDEWIPCSERMPDENEMKANYCSNRHGSEFIVMIAGANRPTTLYRTWDGFWVDDNEVVYRVVAWKPLPESYGMKII